MRFSTALAVTAAVAPIVLAHDGPSMPRIAGLNMRDLKARDMFAKIQARAEELEAKRDPHTHAPQEKKSKLNARQGGTDGQCGAGYANCDAGYCCSEEGWCGVGSDYCYSPGCQYQYGPGCPENQTPGGTNTSSVARTKVGSVAYGGAGIYSCVEDGMIAITYDDGPLQNYTDHILDIFANYAGAKATFFMTGNNLAKGEIDATPELTAVIQKAYAAGHQIASHTWTHLDLGAISQADRLNQMYKNEMALRNILQVFPTYMRPPYSDCTGQCETDLANLGYHIIYFDVDTDDYEQDAPNLIQNSKNWFYGNITANGAKASTSSWLSISHDIHEETAYNLTDYMLSTITSLGYTAVTVGECLGDPEANWYRDSSGTVTTASTTIASSTSSAPTVSATAVSQDATCGGTTGQTCLGSTFGNCCSSAGWCGSTSDYCGDGCQSGFGTCGTSSSSSSSAKTTSTSTAKSSSSSSTKASSSSTKTSSTTVKSSSTSSTKTSSAPTATSTLKVSTDATCGGTTGQTCLGSTFGNCCSVNGWCGSTSDYCGTGCQSGFGTCTSSSSSVSSAKTSSSSIKSSSTSSVKTSTSSIKTSTSSVKTSSSTLKTSTTSTKTSSSAAATSTLKVSTDGSCGSTSKTTCQGSTFGNCCSQYGYCGSTSAYCGTGCLSAYGTCTS